MTIYMWIAAFAWLLIFAGFLLRRYRKLHVPLVVSGILLDIGLVLVLQVSREAVQTALAFSLGPLQQIHIANSSIALLLYFPVFWLGIRLVLGKASGRERNWHRRLAIAALIFRTLGLLFMFSLVNK